MRTCVLVVAIAACGDTRNLVQFDVGYTPDLIAYRDGLGEWQTPGVVTEGTYQFNAVNDFEVVVVGTYTDGTFEAYQFAGTYREGTRWGIFDDTREASQWESICVSAPFPGLTVAITGQMAQAGQVIGGRACDSSTTQGWSFSLDVDPGTYDLIATDPLESSAPRIQIVRGLVVDAGTSVPAIDLSSGVSLNPIEVVVHNPSADPVVETRVVLWTASGSAFVSSQSGTLSTASAIPAYVVPLTALTATDTQAVEVHSPAPGDPFDRSASTTVGPTQSAFELLDAPAIAYDTSRSVDVVSWEAPLEARIGYVDLELIAEAPPLLSAMHLTATTGWLDAQGANSLGLEPDVPGYLPAWLIDRTKAYGRYFDVRDESTAIAYEANTTSQVSGTSAPARARHASKRHRISVVN